MVAKRGITLIEILVVLVIVGVAAAFTVPNLVSSIEQTRVQAARNNLFAITVAQSNFYENNNNNYCGVGVAGCGNTNAVVAQLGVGIPGNDPFAYACVGPLGADPAGTVYRCTATDVANGVTVTLLASKVGANIACAGPAGDCPF